MLSPALGSEEGDVALTWQVKEGRVSGGREGVLEKREVPHPGLLVETTLIYWFLRAER